MQEIDELPQSPGLKIALEEIEALEKKGDINGAFEKTISSLSMIRISDAALRCKLAALCNLKGDQVSAKALFLKAIEHLRKEDDKEKKLINAIKKEISQVDC